MDRQQFWFWISLWQIILSFMPLGTLISQADEPTAMREMELTCIDDAVIHSATFQSNTQHLVFNRKGIFAAFVKSRNEDYTAQNWLAGKRTTSVWQVECYL